MIDAAIVENHDHDWQIKAADGFDFHAAEAERGVAFDGDDRFAAYNGGPDRGDTLGWMHVRV